MSPSEFGTVLVVDDDPSIRRLIAKTLEPSGHIVRVAEGGEEGLEVLASERVDCVVLDIMMPSLGGVEVLRRCRRHYPELPVVMLTAGQSVATAVECVKLGAFDYQLKPVDRDRLQTNVANAVRQHRLTQKLAVLEGDEADMLGMVGSSAPMRKLRMDIRRAAQTNISVHIHGESGTGKELAARAIHCSGGRATGPFVAVNCGAIPPNLQESELFGHERGAFTGAMGRHLGWFEQAQQGTLFLDEVAELSPSAQVRLIRVLQERRLRRIGGSDDIELDVRVISATHRDLADVVASHHFREDLYYRLMVLPLEVPPLRSRAEDIAVLAMHFVDKHSQDAGTPITAIAPEALDALSRHAWKGNVRELENVIHRAIVVTDGSVIGLAALPKAIAELLELPKREALWVPDATAANAVLGGEVIPLATLERRAIDAALEATQGNVSEAARRLGIGRATLYRKLAKYTEERQLDPPGRVG